MNPEIISQAKLDIEFGFAKVSATGDLAIYGALVVVLSLIVAMALLRWCKRKVS